MNDLVDMHCHLLAEIDDGPRCWDDSLAMCRLASEQGVRHVAALAHQCERWNVQADTIRSRVRELRQRVHEAGIELEVHPAAEVMVTPSLVSSWVAGKLISYGDHKRYVLIEMPGGIFVDLRPALQQLGQMGVRTILAHPEQCPELLHESGRMEEWIRLGCLVQISSKSVTDPENKANERALRGWVRRGCVHFLGSDGHSPRKRKPLMADAYQRLREWSSDAVAKQICHDNGFRVLHNQPLKVSPPCLERRWWAALRAW